MIKALGNVMPRHLLDRRLNPVGEIREAIATELEEFDDVPADVPLDSADARPGPRESTSVRAVVQRVTSARVTVDERVTGEIGAGPAGAARRRAGRRPGRRAVHRRPRFATCGSSRTTPAR